MEETTKKQAKRKAKEMADEIIAIINGAKISLGSKDDKLLTLSVVTLGEIYLFINNELQDRIINKTEKLMEQYREHN